MNDDSGRAVRQDSRTSDRGKRSFGPMSGFQYDDAENCSGTKMFRGFDRGGEDHSAYLCIFKKVEVV